MIKKAVLWIAVISCMLIIFIFSSQTANVSQRTSSGFIMSIIRILDFRKVLTPEKIAFWADTLSTAIRKSAHFTIYGILGFLISNLAFLYGIGKKRGAALTVFASFLYAISDEIHQTFVPGRSGQISDVFLDTSGAFFGLIFAMLFRYIISKIRKDNKTDEFQ